MTVGWVCPRGGRGSHTDGRAGVALAWTVARLWVAALRLGCFVGAGKYGHTSTLRVLRTWPASDPRPVPCVLVAWRPAPLPCPRRSQLTGVDDGLTQSRGLLATMSRTALINRLALYAVGGIIGLVLLFIIYVRLFGGRSAPPPGVTP